jgi:hypothetical protein
MQRSKNRILTTHVGSLPRPAELAWAKLKVLAEGAALVSQSPRSYVMAGS